MGNDKKLPKHHVLSTRITDEELHLLGNVSLLTNKSISDLMREALRIYIPYLETTERRECHLHRH